MKTRIITAIVLLCIALPLVIYSYTIAFPIAIAIINVIGVYEMLSCMKMKDKYFLSVPLYLFGAAMPFLLRYLKSEMVEILPKLVIALLFFALYLLTVVVFSHGTLNIGEVFASAMLSLYVIGAGSCILYIRDLTHGMYLWIFIFIAAWVTDIFAYFTGMFFGKHKLIPDVSPKKTVEGSIGGIVFCIIAFIVYGLILNYHFEPNISLAVCAASGLIASVVSQLGDLSMSVIKRNYGVKDFGKLFPGHGGILDRFDSIMAVAVVLAIAAQFMEA